MSDEPGKPGVPHAMVLTACFAKPLVIDHWLWLTIPGAMPSSGPFVQGSRQTTPLQTQGGASGDRDLGRPDTARFVKRTTPSTAPRLAIVTIALAPLGEAGYI